MTYTWFRVGQPVDSPKVVTSGPEEFGRRRRLRRSNDQDTAHAAAQGARDSGKNSSSGLAEDDRHEMLAKQPARGNARRRKTWSEEGAGRFS